IAIINDGIVIENTEMKTLLAKLHVETFVLNSDKNLESKLENWLEHEGCSLKQIDESTFEVEISKKYSLNNLFVELDKRDIKIESLRSKSNRLEELFVHLVEEGTL
ncbi:MAG: ABC transporter ATP-binding protein, partial [Gammaproteobacteria bacterium]|nr:ABC transporter ATP-binding protein [Gammaproteobacteria bacterium]